MFVLPTKSGPHWVCQRAPEPTGAETGSATGQRARCNSRAGTAAAATTTAATATPSPGGAGGPGQDNQRW